MLLLLHIWENAISMFNVLRFVGLVFCIVLQRKVKRFFPGHFGVFECVCGGVMRRVKPHVEGERGRVKV